MEPHSSEEPPLLIWPLDHFYSPVADNRRLSREPDRSRVWPAAPPPTPGIDWRDEAQVTLFRSLAETAPFEFPDVDTGDPTEYHAANGLISRLDAWVLQAMLRHLRPQRMIEVGCGWSSLVSARVNREFLGGSLRLTCIEPYPPEFLKASGGVARLRRWVQRRSGSTGPSRIKPAVDGISELIVSRVEDVPLELFQELGDGDVLFIDTSHTVKTGGDVVFLFNEVLPRLRPGVVIHIHDIFLPWDYPQDWVFAGRAWNEQYLVRAFLSFNSAFRVELGVGWLVQQHPELLAAALPGYPERYGGGGSLWLRRLPD